MADLASFSRDGTILRIAGFLGIGGGANVIQNLISSKGFTAIASFNIGIFLLSGFIGLVGIVILVKYLRTKQIRKTVSSTLGEEQNYWEATARHNYEKNLKQLCSNIQEIQKRYYPKYNEQLTDAEIINRILPQIKLFDKSTVAT